MSTITFAPAPAPARRQVALFYVAQSTTLICRNIFFLIFTIGMPLVMYILFSQLFGGQEIGRTNYSAMTMVAMGAFGAFGAAINGGALLQLERRSGWFRQLQLTSLTPAAFVIGKMAAAMFAVLPAIVIVFLAGPIVGGVDEELWRYVVSTLLIWVSIIPAVVMGVTIALWVKLEAAQAVITIVMMVLAVLGGMFFPSELFPEWMQNIGQWTPTWWMVRIGQWPFIGGDFPVQGVLVLIGWLAILGVGATLGFRRAVRTSKR